MIKKPLVLNRLRYMNIIAVMVGFIMMSICYITLSFMSEDSLKENIGYIFLLFCGSLYLTLTGLCPIVMNIFKKLFKTLRVQK
ncbi:TPA: hypothetical protein MI499_27380 [Klebsiella pneumoniae]|nr:hypothetical protein [Klebsiella pneumoniae]